MAFTIKILAFLAIALLSIQSSSEARMLLSDKNTLMVFKYHNGPLLTGQVSVNLIWYGKFSPSQKSIVTDFILSLQQPSQKSLQTPSIQTWWKNTENYHRLLNNNKKLPSPPSISLSLGKQISEESYSLGKSLTMQQVQLLAAKGGASASAINVVLTASDVAVEGFCSSKCGTHGSLSSKNGAKTTYIWVGNSETQCPGQCAWPFHQPVYGPQSPPLVAPNNDVGVDGMIINLAGLLAGTATNPFGNGFYQGPSTAPLEAASACPGIYAKGAYPGYPGDLPVDSATGASYNVHGVNGRKYLVPALYDPAKKSCSTLI